MKKNPPSKETIQAEIAWLRANKDKIRRMTGFGDDNHEAIDAELDALEGIIDHDSIEDSEYSEHAKDSARGVLDWMEYGDGDAFGEGQPSKSWASLVR